LEFIEYHSTCFGGLSVHHQESKSIHTASGICHTEIPEMDKITFELIYTKQ